MYSWKYQIPNQSCSLIAAHAHSMPAACMTASLSLSLSLDCHLFKSFHLQSQIGMEPAARLHWGAMHVVCAGATVVAARRTPPAATVA